MQFQLRYGIVSDIKKGFVKVSFEDDEIVTDWLPVLVRKSRTDKESWQLEVQEHVVCLMDAFCNEGVCLGAIPNEEDIPDNGEGAGKFRKVFSDGTVIQYDKNSHELTTDVKGNLVAKTTGNAIIEAGQNLEGKAAVKASIEAPAIELKGNVIVTGTLQAGSISTTGSSGPGNLDITGDIIVQGSIEATGDVKGAGKSLATHVHGGVQNGGGTTTLPQ